jgi:serine phosphatase RsbU (regulator of sigma subunit)
MMPGMNGFEVCRKIKNNSKHEALPIIFLTARTDTDSIIQGFDVGAVDYITKPFNKKELLARVSTHLMLKQAHDDIENYLDEITLKNKLFSHSVRYASRIQNAIMPDAELMEELLPEYFVLYLPRDIVSGDFYWIKKYDNSILLAVADCTGHGVPGAFMSILGCTGLNQAVNEYDLTNPSSILSHVHQFLRYALQKTTRDSPVFDGMDITLCKFDLDNKVMECCGANNSIYLVREGELRRIKGERATIGDADFDCFQLDNHEIILKKGDNIYMLTDGYADQFGGDSNKKFSSQRLADLFIKISSHPCSKQFSILENTFEEWKNDQDQIDDVTIFGIRM